MEPAEWAYLAVAVLRTLVWAPEHVAEERLVLRASAELAALWEQDQGKAGQVPAVDFEKEMVVGVFLGLKPSGGYGVWIERVVQHRARKTVYVLYGESHPAGRGGMTDTSSHPCLVAVLPKLAGAVEFVKMDSRLGQELKAQTDVLYQAKP